ncbi:MAG: sigma 54-interacting transcriptional regulator [Acidobacteriota bacterium]
MTTPMIGDNRDPPRESGIVRVLVVHDPRMDTVEGLDDVLVRCRLTPRRPSGAINGSRQPDDCGIALVGVAGEPAPQAPVLENIRRLKDQGYIVLCYASGASRWRLGVQCRLLIAGAAHLFDSSTAAFPIEISRRVHELRRIEIESDRERRRFKQQMLGMGFVGSSAGITAMFRSIVGVSAASDLPVLIAGETGTGKELVARAIHGLDPRRRERPFVPVNCGAISAGLVETELFGHRRGAFTGAEQDRLGLIRAARGGVLFLDEVGDLEVPLQGKLLRVLQERRVLAVGDDHEVPVDVRIIAATNRDLEEMVRQHEFRADLFHRLNVLSVRVPALRDRPEDVEPLVQHFLARCADQARHGTVSASHEFVEALRHVELPGNVRQLENLVRRALATSQSDEPLRLGSLPPELWQELSRTADADRDGNSPNLSTAGDERASPVDAVAVLDAASWKLERALDLCEEQLVVAALGASSGNRARAARLLGISPRCIFNKMRKHRLTA